MVHYIFRGKISGLIQTFSEENIMNPPFPKPVSTYEKKNSQLFSGKKVFLDLISVKCIFFFKYVMMVLMLKIIFEI